MFGAADHPVGGEGFDSGCVLGSGFGFGRLATGVSLAPVAGFGEAANLFVEGPAGLEEWEGLGCGDFDKPLDPGVGACCAWAEFPVPSVVEVARCVLRPCAGGAAWVSPDVVPSRGVVLVKMDA